MGKTCRMKKQLWCLSFIYGEELIICYNLIDAKSIS